MLVYQRVLVKKTWRKKHIETKSRSVAPFGASALQRAGGAFARLRLHALEWDGTGTSSCWEMVGTSPIPGGFHDFMGRLSITGCGIDVPSWGFVSHHFQVSVGDYIPIFE